jgi:DNA-binding HxlR family transcriptional regulator
MFYDLAVRQFLGSIEGISTKTLSIRLNEMEKEGLHVKGFNGLPY